MNPFLIGLIGGTVLGLTGAGGGIASVPLFMHGMGWNFHEASAAALILILVSGLLNGWLQRRFAVFKFSLWLALFSLIGAVGAALIKAQIPDLALKILFIVFCLLSALRIWKNSRTVSHDEIKRTPISQFVGFGALVGALTTLTGVSGGVLYVPWLTTRIGLSLSAAAATSLFATFLTATSSLAAQWNFLSGFMSSAQIVGVAMGAILSAVPITFFLKSFSETQANHIRRGVLTAVIVVSVGSILI